MIELALPAGSLETAITAFGSGADAVYFGLKDFSARKGAVNFSFEDLSKIRRLTVERGRKSYITVNTLIDDVTLPRVISTLDKIAEYGSDGIIVQDLGVAAIMRKYYPSLPLHGSTQLAVHTAEGVRELEDLGFERAVLSRELTMDEIAAIREKCPEIELKCFIHGALCYGFSGLCSASFLKCSRSANGGECAQICRSWFLDEESGRNGYYFSMGDMMAGERLLELDRIGVDSAKVEGRLKSPEYVAAVTRYYRTILDRGREKKEERERVETTFLRHGGDGYLSYRPERPSLLSGQYPGHMGEYCGRITEERGNEKTLATNVDVESHDGLQYFVRNSDGLLESVKFSATVREKGKGYVVLRMDSHKRLKGEKIYRISDSTKRERTPSVNIPLYRRECDIAVTILPSSFRAEALGEIFERDMEVEEGRVASDTSSILTRVFSQSGTSRYTLGKLTFHNNSGKENPFLPPSSLKEFRRAFYSHLDSLPEKRTDVVPDWEKRHSVSLPPREKLCGDLPWSLEPVEIDGRTWITLPPVTFSEEKLWKEILAAAEGKENITIGLNNVAQIRFAKKHPEFSYFADIYLYVSSSWTAALLSKEIPSLIGGYLWFERKEKSGEWPWEPSVTDYEPPYFISRTCYRHDALGLSCKGCPRKGDWKIAQAPDTFTVKVRDCLTVVVRDKR